MFCRQLRIRECVQNLQSVLKSSHIKMDSLHKASVHKIFERKNKLIELKLTVHRAVLLKLEHIPGGPLKHIASSPICFCGHMEWGWSDLHIWQILGWLLLLLVWGPHCKNHWLREVNIKSTKECSGFEGKKKKRWLRS